MALIRNLLTTQYESGSGNQQTGTDKRKVKKGSNRSSKKNECHARGSEGTEEKQD